MMQRQQKARAGAGRLARKLGPALWTTAALAAALLTGSCTGGRAAPAASPLGAGVVVAAANRPEPAGRSEGSLTTESTTRNKARAGQPTTADITIGERLIASTTATPVDRPDTPSVYADAAPSTGAQEAATRVIATRAETAAPSATPIPATPEPTATRTPVATSTPSPAPQLVVREDANVRWGPGTTYPIIGGLAAGQNYPVAARNPDGSWLEFDYGSATGWVSAALVSAVGDFGSLPVAAHIPPPPSPTKAPATRMPFPGPSDPVIADLVGRINRARADAGLDPLRWTPELAQAAGAHTWDMATHHFFGHTGSDGSDVTVRIRRAGYIPVYWGEILTHVNGGGGPDAAYSQFWNSPHHHDIILGDKFTDIGAAWIKDPADGSFNYYAVVFGKR